MKYLFRWKSIIALLLLIPFFNSCEKEADEFSNSTPVTYYLSYGEALSPTVGPDGGWNYITNYIYPSSTTSCEWSVHLNNNITKGDFGYDLLFWTETQSSVKIEFILKEGSTETVLASNILDIPYISETSAIHHHMEAEVNPLAGTNPKSGKDDELIFRITYESGSDPVEILYDGNTGMMGCTCITVFEDI